LKNLPSIVTYEPEGFPDISLTFRLDIKTVAMSKAEKDTCQYFDLTLDEALAIMGTLKIFTDTFKEIK